MKPEEPLPIAFGKHLKSAAGNCNQDAGFCAGSTASAIQEMTQLAGQATDEEIS